MEPPLPLLGLDLAAASSPASGLRGCSVCHSRQRERSGAGLPLGVEPIALDRPRSLSPGQDGWVPELPGAWRRGLLHTRAKL